MHCSDEELLAHLDGELPPLRHIRVWFHLKSCWRCRTRLDASEQEIHRLAVAMDEWPFPPPEWGPTAEKRLLSRIEEHEDELAKVPRRTIRFAIPAAGVAAASLAVIAAWHFGIHRANAPIRPVEVIAHAAGVETTLYAQPVHQTFSVQIVQSRPTAKTVDSELQIWSDRSSGRFASRLSGPGGELRHAMWRPAKSREFVYRGGGNRLVERQQHRIEAASLTSLAANGLDPDQIESTFLNWMESRSWNPISLSSDISIWAAEDGTVAAAERLTGHDGTPLIRITARRKTRTLVAVLSLDVDSSNYQPRIETIRFETADRTVEFRLAADSIREVSRAELSPAVFRPDPSLEHGTMAMPEGAPTGGAPSVSLPPARPRLNAVDIRELQARYVLHQAGACLGEAVQVIEEPGGFKVMRVGEASGYSAGGSMDFVLRALADLRREQPLAVLPDSALGVALRHAWALKRLSVFFESRQTPGPADPSGRLLAEMVRDHRGAVERELKAAGVQPPGASGRRFRAGDWREPAGDLFPRLMQFSDATGRQRSVDGRVLAAIYGYLDELKTAFPDAAR